MSVSQSLMNTEHASRYLPAPKNLLKLMRGQTQLKKRGLDKLLEEAKADESGFDDSILSPGNRRK